AELLQELGDHFVAKSAGGPLEKRERLRIRAGECVELLRELGERRVPGDRLELLAAARSRPRERRGDAIGVIGQLNRGLPAGAQLSLADWMRGVAFELLREPH